MTDFTRELWYVGKVSRAITNQLLLGKEEGLYLLRDSSTCVGDYVLCVSENKRVSNYIINSMPNGDYKIGENIFKNLIAVIKFYTENLLDTTRLIKCVIIEKVRGKYDFPGNDDEDLPFKKGELLYVIEKTEEQWWEAFNQQGVVGSIPAPYIVSETKKLPATLVPAPSVSSAPAPSSPLSAPPMPQSATDKQPPLHHPVPPPVSTLPSPPAMPASAAAMSGPVWAVAIMDRNPSAYDQKFLAFKAGDRIRVTQQNENGLWEGECNGRSGLFPFNHVKVTDNL